MPGLPVHQQLLAFTQTHVHRVGDAIQPSHPLSSPSPPAPNLSHIRVFSNEMLLDSTKKNSVVYGVWGEELRESLRVRGGHDSG